MMAVIGSWYGTGATSTRPAPRLPRRLRPLLPEPRVPRVRLETEVELRLDCEVDDRVEPVRDEFRDDPLRAVAAPSTAGFTAPAGAAVPQVSQYPSASMWPSQPASRQA